MNLPSEKRRCLAARAHDVPPDPPAEPPPTTPVPQGDPPVSDPPAPDQKAPVKEPPKGPSGG